LKGGAYSACVLAFFRKGLFPEVEENLTLAIEMTQKTDFVGFLLVGLVFSGGLHYAISQYQEAQECYDAALAVYERIRERIRWRPSNARLTQILKVLAGVRGRLNPTLDGLLNFDLQEIMIRSVQGRAARVMGEIYLYMDDAQMDEAETWIRRAIEADERNRMPWDLARDYALYAEFFKKRSKTPFLEFASAGGRHEMPKVSNRESGSPKILSQVRDKAHLGLFSVRI
jgi:tetratricopeptide (TPR) repeat protein